MDDDYVTVSADWLMDELDERISMYRSDVKDGYGEGRDLNFEEKVHIEGKITGLREFKHIVDKSLITSGTTESEWVRSMNSFGEEVNKVAKYIEKVWSCKWVILLWISWGFWYCF